MSLPSWRSVSREQQLDLSEVELVLVDPNYIRLFEEIIVFQTWLWDCFGCVLRLTLAWCIRTSRLCAGAALRLGRVVPFSFFLATLWWPLCCLPCLCLQRLSFDSHEHVMAQVRSKRITHFHGGRACLWNRPISVWESLRESFTNYREQLQRVSAGHQAPHEAPQSIQQELATLRSQIDTRSRIRMVEPKSLIPDRFGKKNGQVGEPGRTWQETSSA